MFRARDIGPDPGRDDLGSRGIGSWTLAGRGWSCSGLLGSYTRVLVLDSSADMGARSMMAGHCE